VDEEFDETYCFKADFMEYGMQADLHKVLAVWIFLHPTTAMKALAWLRINGYPNGFETIGKVHLSEQEIQALDEHLGVDEHGGNTS